MINAFETKANLKEATTLLRTEIKSLKSLVRLDKTQRAIINPIILEKMNLLEYISGLKSWNFNFEGGGWNSNVAKTKEESYKMALKEYKGSKNCVPSKETFRVATDADTKNLLSLFY